MMPTIFPPSATGSLLAPVLRISSAAALTGSPGPTEYMGADIILLTGAVGWYACAAALAKSLSVTMPAGLLSSVITTAPTPASSIILATSPMLTEASADTTELPITSLTAAPAPPPIGTAGGAALYEGRPQIPALNMAPQALDDPRPHRPEMEVYLAAPFLFWVGVTCAVLVSAGLAYRAASRRGRGTAAP